MRVVVHWDFKKDCLLRVCIVLFPGVLKQVIDKCVVGASVREICEFGDSLLLEETSKVFKKEKELKKGKPPIWQLYHCVSFPVRNLC
jgi:methionine aminopeptidase